MIQHPIIREVLDLVDDYDPPQKAAILFTGILVSIAETEWQNVGDADAAVQAIADSLVRQWPTIRDAMKRKPH